jgi:glycine cleavage system H lipoate-binding protein
MTVALVLFTFITFLLIDFFLSKKKAPVFAERTQPVRQASEVPRFRSNLVNGFEVPDHLRYHPGHTWALSESPNLVRVGMDEFAAKLIGRVEGVSLPQRGQWIRQGQKILSFKKNDIAVDMVSPIEGSVANVNEAVLANPEAARQDPYGEGWLLTVLSPDAKTNFRNLMGGALTRWWMEEAAARLQKRLPAAAGSLALAQDGGIAADELGAGLSPQELKALTQEFFLF